MNGEQWKEINLDIHPKELIKILKTQYSSTDNALKLGIAVLNFQAQQLQEKATKRLTFATWVLAGVAFIQLLLIIF